MLKCRVLKCVANVFLRIAGTGPKAVCFGIGSNIYTHSPGVPLLIILTSIFVCRRFYMMKAASFPDLFHISSRFSAACHDNATEQTSREVCRSWSKCWHMLFQSGCFVFPFLLHILLSSFPRDY